MKLLKYLGYTTLGLIIFIIGSIFVLSIQRETKEWTENISVAPNTEISVDLMSSQRGCFRGHGLG
ncbi:hypothetical protein AB832_00585 [Flavobacteriaceae bacterium (ex Bugula neritina AB1)]|nr:hypothetical protein AB832_00585 [Flavobacteriaceae bacterium (ex Bugula neritina AB1)]